MADLKGFLYSSKIIIGNIVFGLVLYPLVYLFIPLSGSANLLLVFYVILNTAISIRWLMRINSYDMQRKEKTQEEALQQAMAVAMTLSPRGP